MTKVDQPFLISLYGTLDESENIAFTLWVATKNLGAAYSSLNQLKAPAEVSTQGISSSYRSPSYKVPESVIVIDQVDASFIRWKN